MAMRTSDEQDGDERRRMMASLASRSLGAGLQFAAAILLFMLLGHWLDGRFGTGPWLLLLGVMIGSVGGFYSLYWQLVLAPRDRERERRGDHPSEERSSKS
jgi:F0F1-type ATP synthase assembly protein I